MIRVLLALHLAALGACSESNAEDLVPGAREVTFEPVLRAGFDLAPTDNGWAVVWGEVPPDEGATILYLTLLDAVGDVLEPAREIATIPDEPWPRLHLLVTPTGYNVWHLQSYRHVGVIVFDDNGEELSRDETDVMLDWRTSGVDVVAIGDTVLLASRPQSGNVQVRLYNDQGIPRTDQIALGTGGDLDAMARTDRFEVFFDDSSRVLRAVISTTGEVITPAEVVSTDPDSRTRGVAVAPVGEDGAFIAWKRDEGLTDGALYDYRAEMMGWSEPRTLHPANRRESLDFCVGSSGTRIFIGRQSDVDHAIPQLLLGSIDPMAGELSTTAKEPLTLPGVRAGDCIFEAGPMGLAALFSAEVDGQSRIFFERVAE
jgi:hypothetical protein